MANRCSLLSIHFTLSVIDIRPTILRQTRHLAAETSVTVFFKHHLDQARLYDSVVHDGGLVDIVDIVDHVLVSAHFLMYSSSLRYVTCDVEFVFLLPVWSLFVVEPHPSRPIQERPLDVRSRATALRSPYSRFSLVRKSHEWWDLDD
jgi:hypothetical protein